MEFKQKEALEFHLKRYHFDIPFTIKFKCVLCSYQTNRRPNFSRHMRHKHDPFHVQKTCNNCGKSFGTQRGLKEHMEVHADTEYKCNVCNHVGQTKRGLKCHMTHVHQENKYECPVCPFQMRSADEARMHLAQNHPDYEENE